MKRNFIFGFLILMIFSCKSTENKKEEPSLYKNSSYPVGTMVRVNSFATQPEIIKIVKRDFNRITAGTSMKMNRILNPDLTLNFENVDKYTAFAEENNMHLHGHTLIWHSSTPDYVSKMEGDSAALTNFMKEYITNYVSHYKGKIESWDVVNEPVLDSTGDYRETMYYNTLGEKYLELAFQLAHEADPDAKLFINDYNIERDTAKLNGLLRIVKNLQNKGIPIHGIGMQMHIRVDIPDDIIAYTIKKCAETGLLIHLSEMDVIFNIHDDSRGGGRERYTSITDEMLQLQAEKYRSVAQIYNTFVPKEQQFGITLWDFSDKHTWIRGFFGMNDWPCIYNDSLERKPAYYGFLEGLTL